VRSLLLRCSIVSHGKRIGTSTAVLQKHENSQIYMNSIDLAVGFIADSDIRRFCWCIAVRDFGEEDL
jgi:hypothetical protein